jgi:hypothetical protein
LPLVELANTTNSVKGSTKRGIIVQARTARKVAAEQNDEVVVEATEEEQLQAHEP